MTIRCKLLRAKSSKNLPETDLDHIAFDPEGCGERVEHAGGLEIGESLRAHTEYAPYPAPKPAR